MATVILEDCLVGVSMVQFIIITTRDPSNACSYSYSATPQYRMYNTEQYFHFFAICESCDAERSSSPTVQRPRVELRVVWNVPFPSSLFHTMLNEPSDNEFFQFGPVSVVGADRRLSSHSVVVVACAQLLPRKWHSPSIYRTRTTENQSIAVGATFDSWSAVTRVERTTHHLCFASLPQAPRPRTSKARDDCRG